MFLKLCSTQRSTRFVSWHLKELHVKHSKRRRKWWKQNRKKSHGTHKWWNDSTTMISASRSCHPSNIFNLSNVWVEQKYCGTTYGKSILKRFRWHEGSLFLQTLHKVLKGWRTTKSTSWAPQRIDSYRTEVEDIYMPNKACKSIPQLRRVPSHKLKITAWQKIHTKTARKSIAQLRRDPSHSEVFHMHRDERHCKLYEGTVKASNTSHGMSYRHHSSYTYYYIFSKA